MPSVIGLGRAGAEIAFRTLEAGLEVEYARELDRLPLMRGGDALEGEETTQLLDEGAIQIEFAYRNSNEAVVKEKRDTSSTACE